MTDNQQNNKSRKKLVVLVLISLFVIFVAVRAINKYSTGAESLKGDVVRDKWPVNVETIKPATFVQRVISNGILSPLEEASLSCEVAAKVREIKADLGDRVKKGKVLINIDGSAYYLNREAAKAQLAEASANATFQKETLIRKEALAKEGHISKEELEQAQAASKSAKAMVRTAKANLNIAQRNVGETSIRAPFTGRVSSRSVSPGEMVSPGIPLITIIQDHVMKVDLALSEREIMLVHKDMTVKVNFPSIPGKIFQGKITRIGVAADRASGSFPVRIEIDNSNYELLSGMRANLEIELKIVKDSIVLTRDHIVKIAGSNFAFIAQEQEGEMIAKAIKVEIQDTFGQDVLIASGLEMGQKLVVVGQNSLKDNTPILIIEQDGIPVHTPAADSPGDDKSDSPTPSSDSEESSE